MLFTPESIDLILSGKKVQTRRPVKPPEFGRMTPTLCTAPSVLQETGARPGAVVIFNPDQVIFRTKWTVGHAYAVQPGRGKKAVAWIEITGIRCEYLRDINDIGAALEGIQYDPARESLCYGGMLLDGETADKAYLNLWQSLYPKSDLSELVWVLDFQVTS